MTTQPEPPPSSITHLAGTAITWAGQFLRQRCEWCGAILVDYDLTLTASIVPEGKTEEQARADGDLTPATWPVGSFVRVDGDFPQVMTTVEAQPSEEDPTQTQAPEDSCMRLDPAVTA